MTAFLKIENPGVAPKEAFTLLGASTKRGQDNAIGKFGSGNKHGVAVLLRAGLEPVVFAGHLRMDFGTRPTKMDTGLGWHSFERVVVKYGGTKHSTEDLGFVLDYGSTDWLSVDLALREFVSNALDRAAEEAEVRFLEKWFIEHGYTGSVDEIPEDWKISAKHALLAWRPSNKFWQDCKIEVVNENQVRAKKGFTRIFVPMNSEVFEFFNNLGKWFLHFSEPELLNKTILPKSNRNLGDRQTAVIYRRGVRVREFESSDIPSLFDYNLEELELDESRKVDDWRVMSVASRALAGAEVEILSKVWQSFLSGDKVWEHEFSDYGLGYFAYRPENKEVWTKAFEAIMGSDAVIATPNGGEMAARKGYKVLHAPAPFVNAAAKYGIKTPDAVLTSDQKEGREVLDPTSDAIAAVEWAWDLAQRYKLTNGKTRPAVKTFRKIMDGGAQTLGYYRDGTVFFNTDISANETSVEMGWQGLSHQLLATALEEVVHHITGAIDNSRDFQDYILNLVVHIAR